MDNLFNFSKIEYIRGKKRPTVDCILCAIKDKNPEVDSLDVYSTRFSTVCVNLYPYNSGHLLIFPNRHIEDIRKLTDEEILDIEHLTQKSINILEKLYLPAGFNIGYNLGHQSGASISHIHRHIVPRYPNEIGFIDIIGGAKIIIEDPQMTMVRLREAFIAFKD